MTVIEVKQAKELADTSFGDPVLTMAVNAVLDKAPKFELVRCKDCKYRMIDKHHGEDWCSHAFGLSCEIYETDFCSHGERRSDEN